MYHYRARNRGFFSISNSKLLLAVGTLITLFMAVNLVKAIDENRKIQGRIDKLQDNLEVLVAENEELSDNYDYVQTDLFVETEARNKLNYKEDGETVVSLPPEKVAIREEIEAEHQALLERNLKSNPQKWLDYFFAEAQAAEN